MHTSTRRVLEAMELALAELGPKRLFDELIGSDQTAIDQLKREFMRKHRDWLNEVNNAGESRGKSETLADIARKAINISRGYAELGEITTAEAFAKFADKLVKGSAKASDEAFDYIKKVLDVMKEQNKG